LYIDATPPESFLCTKFVPVEHQDITDIDKDEFVWSQTIPSQIHDILKIEVVVRDIRLGFRAYLTYIKMIPVAWHQYTTYET
jgi:hypothetical protein